MSHPYQGVDFFGFFAILFQRVFLFLTGQLSLQDLATDEVQLGVLSLIAMSCALIGSFLVLKKMTMLANSLSHTILLGIVICLLFFQGGLENLEDLKLSQVFIAALIAAFLTTCLTEWMTRVMRLQEDASIGLVFTTLFALSIACVTAFTRSTHVGIDVIMGNSDALDLSQVKLISSVFFFDLLVIFVFFKEFVMSTFDRGLTESLGFSPTLMSYILMFLTAGTVVASFKAVGVLLVLSFLVGPVLAARLWTHRVSTLILLSMGFGVFAVLVGVALSRHLLSTYEIPLSTSGLIVCVLGMTYLAIRLLVSLQKKRILKT